MAQGHLKLALRRIRHWLGPSADQSASDEALLDQFVRSGDHSAFDSLLHRHGPLVLGVCRRLLGDPHDAEDAFQATFLVLARKAASVRRGEALGGWLHRVAHRIALAARAQAARRREKEREAMRMLPTTAAGIEPDAGELGRLIDDEVDRLPGKYRLPMILCCLEGKTHEEAARDLGWPTGTVAGRLSRGKELLRQRLSRRGLALPAAALAMLAAEGKAAALPAELAQRTLAAAAAFVQGGPASLAINVTVATLAQGALHTMFWNQLKLAAGIVLAVAGLGIGVAAYLHQASAAPPAAGPNNPALAPPARPPLSPEAFAALNQADLAFVAKVANVVGGPVGLSSPPLYTMQITFETPAMLRGKAPANLTFSYSKRAEQPPEFPNGAAMLVAANRNPAAQGQTISFIIPAEQANLDQARQAAAMPSGWMLQDGKPVSPWAQLGGKARWPGNPAPVACAVTGRPALLAGPGVDLQVEQIIPDKVEKFKNPFGDGQFKITVRNTTDQPIEIPALLASGKDIYWDNSLVILAAGKPHLLPGAGAIPADARPLRLPAGGSVSTTINTLTLANVSWPRGGSRIYFQFCLGELARSDFFYYHSGHHDALRARLRN